MLHGTLTLNTIGVAQGTYYIVLDQMAALDLSLVPADLPVSGVGATYTISAVPEPSSAVLVCLAACTFYFRKAKRSARQPKGASPG